VRLRLDAQEATVLAALVEQLVSLLGGEREIDDLDVFGEGGRFGTDDAVGRPGVPDEGAARPAGDLPAFGLSDNTTVSDDPVLARLFPDAYREDDKAAAEFRRYTEVGLRDGKVSAATAVLDDLGSGGEVLLDDERAQSWLRALNDLRLALGTRLEITEEIHERLGEIDPGDSRYPAFVAYDWLSFLQESLVRALL
jgi:hypothetical protein